MKLDRSFRHVIALLLAIVMLVGCLPATVFAATPETQAGNDTAENGMMLTVSSATCMPGDTIEITIDVANNPGIASLKFDVVYDSALTLTNVTFDSAFGAMVGAPTPYTNPQPITMISPLADNSANGAFVTMTFVVNENVADGYVADICITHNPADIFNAAYEDVPVQVSNGKISVYHGMPGDVDGNRTVNTKDAIELFRHVAGWTVDVDMDALDVNGDNAVNTKDAIELFRYVAGWEGITLHYGPVKHIHNLVMTEEKDATCTEDGNVLYFHCTDCNKYYTDATAKTEINLADTVLTANGHAAVAQEAKDATCTEDGNIGYWYCAGCEGCYLDADCTQVVSEVVITASGHELTKVTEKASSCTESGNITYWHCETCGKNYQEEAAINELMLDDTVISATGHTLQYVAAKAATCTEDGNVDHWYCPVCAGYFADSEANDKLQAAEIVLAATGHGENLTYIAAKAATLEEEGNTEYWHCSECDKYFSDAAAKTEIAKADTVISTIPSYTITFVDEYNWPTGEKVKFAQSEPLLLTTYLPPEVTGYTFNGWYTAEGKIVEMIAVGNTADMTLRADWDPTKYTITYLDAAKNSNPVEYTIENEIILAKPEWSGLSFENWTDEKGNVVTKISKGTVGNITLTANWISERNMAVPSKNTAAKSVLFDEDLGRFYFIYEMGTIENIELSVLGTDDKSTGEEVKWILSQTVSVENSIADTVARAVTKSYSQTSEWSETYEFVQSQSINSKITSGLEVEEFGVKAKIEAEIGVTSDIEQSRGYGRAGSTTGGTEESNSASSTVSYTKGLSTTITKEITIPGDMPKGKYSYVLAGTVRVYAIVTYDPVEQNYYIDTYSILDDRTYEKRMYDAPADITANISYSEGLAFDIDEQYIKNYVKSAYYVQYDVNGGVGNPLPLTVGSAYGEITLLNATGIYTREGYTFGGWEFNGSSKIYNNTENIRDIATAGEVVTAYAHWIKNSYTIQYNANKPTSASSNVQNMPGNTGATYDTAIKLGSKPSLTGWTFGGWYLEAACTTKVGDAGATIANANLTAVPGGTVTLYAKWTANTYTVTYDANGGSVDIKTQNKIYDSTYGSLPTPTRTDYVFIGWYNGSTEVEDSTMVTTAGNHTLKAAWVRTTDYITLGNGKTERHYIHWKSGNHTDGKDTIIPSNLNKAQLVELGYTKMEVTMTFWYRVEDWGSQLIQIHSNTDAEIKRCEYEWKECGWTQLTIEFEVAFNQTDSSGGFWIEWDLWDDEYSSDTWYVGGTTLTLTAIK